MTLGKKFIPIFNAVDKNHIDKLKLNLELNHSP